MNILIIFWTNVDWHRRNKGLTWTDLTGGSSTAASRGELNPSLKKVQQIATKLDIDDYSILFEEVGD